MIQHRAHTSIYQVFFFKKYKFTYFNWRLITLQDCTGFAIHQRESAKGVHMFPILNNPPPPSPYHPSGSSQCTSPKHPVSCIEPGLEFRFLYDIIHVSMPGFSCKFKKVIYIGWIEIHVVANTNQVNSQTEADWSCYINGNVHILQFLRPPQTETHGNSHYH